MIILFLGPPGSGKGTQSKLLSDKKSFLHLSTGDLLRQAVKEETPLGKQAQSFMQKGSLVPDSLVLALLEQNLITNLHQYDAIILDGFPRTLNQALALEENLKKNSEKIAKVIFFDIKDDLIIERLSARRTCSKCGNTYNLKTQPPLQEGLCDTCKQPLIQRVDDRAEIIKERLTVYHQETKPLLDYYNKQNLLIKVNAVQTPEELLSSILKTL